MKLVLIALFAASALIAGWEVRRGLTHGKMRFQMGFLERENSPVFFWAWFVILLAVALGLSALAIAALLTIWSGRV